MRNIQLKTNKKSPISDKQDTYLLILAYAVVFTAVLAVLFGGDFK